MRRLGVVVAEVDPQLRYVWIDNPHPDFDSTAVVGKRDDELISQKEAREFMQMKRDALKRMSRVSRLIGFKRSDGDRHYQLTAYPIVSDADGKMVGVLTVGFDTTRAVSMTE